jgi:hypothetical protein
MAYLTAWILAAGLLAQHQHMSGGMDFDQDATAHHFRLARDGGSIEIETRTAGDTALRDMVRTHLRTLPQDFAAGNFEKPLATHGETPDGVPEMIRLKDHIAYSFETLKQGGRVRIRAATPEALAAVHAFLRYQIREHHTGDAITVSK